MGDYFIKREMNDYVIALFLEGFISSKLSPILTLIWGLKKISQFF